MSDQFFIGREKELERIEQFTLVGSASLSNPRICHIWGEDGIGKTSLMDKFISLLNEENTPVLWLYPKPDERLVSRDAFYSRMIEGSGSNLGDLESWLSQLKAMLETPAGDSSQSPDFRWSQHIVKTLQSASESGITSINELLIMIVVDDFDRLPSEIRISLCVFINRLKELLSEEQRLAVMMSANEDLLKIPDIYGYWESSLNDALEIRLENLTREEATRLLDAHDIDPNLIHKIYNETRGNPGLINASINDKNTQSINSEEWYNRGKNLLNHFNNLQQKWLKWAAVIKDCNEETVSLITNSQEGRECMNWIRSNYPNYFTRDNGNYSLLSENRRAVTAYLKKEDEELYNRLSSIIQKFITVKHSIPNAQHRKLLSYLSELQYFDLPLIKKLFDESTTEEIYALFENKPIFFREENQNYRLASNIRSSISIYNSLIDLDNRDRLRNKIAQLWEQKRSELHQQLTFLEKSLHEHEEKNRSLTVSLGKIDEEINRLKKQKSPDYQPVRQSTPTQKKSFTHMIGAFSLQSGGIALLYVDILVFDELSVNYLLLAAAMIAAGIFMSLNNRKQEQPAYAEGSLPAHSEQQIDKILQHLELDRVSMLNQKEKTRTQMELEKSTLLTLQNQLKQSYLPESQAD